MKICENCGKEHDGSYGSGRFCCKECARSFSTKNDKKELKEAKCIDCGKIVLIDKRRSVHNFRCDDCKKNILKSKCKYFPDINCNDFCYFKQHNICNKNFGFKRKLNTLKKYCGLKISDYNITLNEYLNIKNNIQYFIDSGYSTVDICNHLFKGIKKGNTIFNILNIKVKNLSEAYINAFLQGKMNPKEGWYTTWEGKEIYLRSSYEEDYAKELDENKITYEYENLQIKYFNTQQNKFKCAIPDFYLPDTNTIVEIKSTWTLDIQEMKDKVKAYKELGYNFKLILNHKDQTNII